MEGQHTTECRLISDGYHVGELVQIIINQKAGQVIENPQLKSCPR